MKNSLSILLIFCSINMTAQGYNWSEDIAPIIFENCVSCHRDGGIAPFTLVNYTEVSDGAFPIALAVNHRDMPPWPADPDYMHFANEAVLSDEDIEAIVWWAENDMPIGDITLEPPLPVFPEPGSLLETIDLTLEIDSYTLQSNEDEYRWFAFENTSTEDVYLSKLEVVSGLESVVHHVDLYYDASGNSMAYDDADPLPGFNSSTSWPATSVYINAWQPGGNIVEYPIDWGIKIPAGADYVIEIHYGPGGQGLTDNTKMNLQFLTSPGDDIRPVTVQWFLNQSPSMLIDGPLVIPPNEVTTFHQITQPTSIDISLISICPHMHLLGRSYKVWYEDPAGDEHPLIDIPHWDFHWQKYYTFQTVKHIPAGSIIKSEGSFDNTINNHDNPFDPPQLVTGGSTTLDEMFLCYFIYADYEPGDEFIIMDEDLLVGIEDEVSIVQEEITLFPNPVSETMNLQVNEMISGEVSLRIYDVLGKVIYSELAVMESSFSLEIDASKLSQGMYYLEFTCEKISEVKEFVKR
jgi:hypothetical protein